ncbi:MAG: hypothetical protein ACLFT1_04795 [Desulfonatronovibrio sp.]
MKSIIMLGLIFFFWATLAGGNPSETGQSGYISQLGTASMDWTRGRIVAGGAASFELNREDPAHQAIIAEREAKIRAIRNLYDSLGEIYLNSSVTLDRVQDRDQDVMRDVSTMVQQAVVVDKVSVSGSRHLVEVFVMLDLWDEHVRMFMPEDLFITPEISEADSEDALLPGDCVIYVDALDVDAAPAVIPSITDEHGNILFRASVLGSGKSAGTGRISYVGAAHQGRKFKTTPNDGQTMWIRPEKSSGRFHTDLQLDSQGAEKFKSVVSSTRDDCSVKIILE